MSITNLMIYWQKDSYSHCPGAVYSQQLTSIEKALKYSSAVALPVISIHDR